MKKKLTKIQMIKMFETTSWISNKNVLVFENLCSWNIKMAKHKKSQFSKLAALALLASVSYGLSGVSQSLSYYNFNTEKFALYNPDVFYDKNR